MYLTFSFVGVVARGTVVTVFYQAILSLFLLFIFYIFLQAFLSGSGKYKYTKILFKNTWLHIQKNEPSSVTNLGYFESGGDIT